MHILDGSIVGQDLAQQMLANTIVRGRIPHALLIFGAAGVGKYSLATAYASSLNCSGRGGSVMACSACTSCRQIRSGNHPDVSTIEPDGSFIKIDQIRGVTDKVSYRSYCGGYKVIIIRNADRMREEAANSMLKILEEPPDRTVFVLTAHNRYSILPTILSRCQPIRVNPLPANQLAELLVRRYGIEPARARTAAYLASGSVKSAIEISSDPAIDQLRTDIISQMRRLSRLPVWQILSLSSSLAGRKDDKRVMERALSIMELWYRDLLIYRQSRADDIIANQDMIREVAESSKEYDTTELITKLRRLSAARQQLSANANPGLVLDNLYLALARS